MYTWCKVIESIEPDKITYKSIKSFLFPPTEKDLPDATIRLTPSLHEDIHKGAADRGMSIVDLIKAMFDFFISGEKYHHSKHDVENIDYAGKERIWREDLRKLGEERAMELS